MDRHHKRAMILLVLLTLGSLGLGLYYSSLLLDASIKFQSRISGAIWVSPRLRHPQAANFTLGFGAVYAISGANAVQQQRLVETADATQVNVSILDAADPKVSELKALRKFLENRITEEEAVSWLNHRSSLLSFAESGLETGLFIGHDVDWASNLRTSQIPVAAATVQKITVDQVGFASQILDQPRLKSYWGVVDSWDVLNLGDCGEDANWKSNGQPLVSPEDTLSPRAIARGDPPSVASKRHLAPRSDPPLCASAYAVTRHSAKRLLDVLSGNGIKSQASNYDERMTEICRDSLLRCLSISPRMLHRVHPQSRASGGG